MAKYEQYAEYKDSGVEWLGKIPSHWEISSLKRCVDGCTNGIWGSEPEENSDNTVVLRVADFDRNKLEISEDKLTLRNISLKESESRLLKKGDLLIEKSGGGDKTLVGCVVLFDKDFRAVTSNFVAKMTPKIGYESSFLKYAFSLLYDGRVNYASIKQTTGIQNLDSDAYLMEKFVFPEKNEQTQIANFLDHETAQIDTLIDKQQTLIQLLKEKRQAVISHAVTKGLNPNMPMKDSGVEWLGEVPEHWNFATVRRYLLEHRQGYYTSDPYVDDGTKLLRITDLRELGEIDIKECPMVSQTQSLKNYLLKEGDVVFARTGGAGSFGVIPKLKEDVAYASYLIRFRFLPRFFDTEYLRFMLIADSFQLAVKSNIHGGVTQNIHAEDIKNTFVASPPLEEQNKISSYLIAQTNSYADLINKAEQAIQLMQERRTALISAAVTGKIDVRGWQGSENEVVF